MREEERKKVPNSKQNHVRKGANNDEEAEEGDGNKSLYDICFDQVTFVILSLIGCSETESNGDVIHAVLQSFFAHIRRHKSNSYCLPSHLMMYKLLFYSRPLQLAANEANCVQKLFGLLTKYYESQSRRPEKDLNSFLLGQGIH